MMSYKGYLTVAGTIFALIAVLHLSRILLAWDAILGEWIVPMWVSWGVLVIAGYLAYQAFMLSRK